MPDLTKLSDYNKDSFNAFIEEEETNASSID